MSKIRRGSKLSIKFILLFVLTLSSLVFVFTDMTRASAFKPPSILENKHTIVDNLGTFTPDLGVYPFNSKNFKSAPLTEIWGPSKSMTKYMGEIPVSLSEEDDLKAFRVQNSGTIDGVERPWGKDSGLKAGDIKPEHKDLHIRAMAEYTDASILSVGVYYVAYALYFIAGLGLKILFILKDVDMKMILDAFGASGEVQNTINSLFLISDNGDMSPFLVIMIFLFMLSLVGVIYQAMKGEKAFGFAMREFSILLLAGLVAGLSLSQSSQLTVAKWGVNLSTDLSNTIVSSATKDAELFTYDTGTPFTDGNMTQIALLEKPSVDSFIASQFGVPVADLAIKDKNGSYTKNFGKDVGKAIEATFKSGDFGIDAGKGEVHNLGYYWWVANSNVASKNPIKGQSKIKNASNDRYLYIIDFLNNARDLASKNKEDKVVAKIDKISSSLSSPDWISASVSLFLISILKVSLLYAFFLPIIFLSIGKIIVSVGTFGVPVLPGLILVKKTRKKARELVKTYLLGFFRYIVGLVIVNLIVCTVASIASQGNSGIIVASVMAIIIARLIPKIMKEINMQVARNDSGFMRGINQGFSKYANKVESNRSGFLKNRVKFGKDGKLTKGEGDKPSEGLKKTSGNTTDKISNDEEEKVKQNPEILEADTKNKDDKIDLNKDPENEDGPVKDTGTDEEEKEDQKVDEDQDTEEASDKDKDTDGSGTPHVESTGDDQADVLKSVNLDKESDDPGKPDKEPHDFESELLGVEKEKPNGTGVEATGEYTIDISKDKSNPDVVVSSDGKPEKEEDKINNESSDESILKELTKGGGASTEQDKPRDKKDPVVAEVNPEISKDTANPDGYIVVKPGQDNPDTSKDQPEGTKGKDGTTIEPDKEKSGNEQGKPRDKKDPVVAEVNPNLVNKDPGKDDDSTLVGAPEVTPKLVPVIDPKDTAGTSENKDPKESYSNKLDSENASKDGSKERRESKEVVAQGHNTEPIKAAINGDNDTESTEGANQSGGNESKVVGNSGVNKPVPNGPKLKVPNIDTSKLKINPKDAIEADTAALVAAGVVAGTVAANTGNKSGKSEPISGNKPGDVKDPDSKDKNNESRRSKEEFVAQGHEQSNKPGSNSDEKESSENKINKDSKEAQSQQEVPAKPAVGPVIKTIARTDSSKTGTNKEGSKSAPEVKEIKAVVTPKANENKEIKVPDKSVTTSDATNVKPDSKSKSASEVKENKVDMNPKVSAGNEIVKPDVKPMVKPDIKPVIKPINTETEGSKTTGNNSTHEVKENKDIKKPEVKSVIKPETKPVPKPDSTPEVKNDSKPEIKPDSKTVSKPEVKPVVKPESSSEPKPDRKSKSEPEVKSVIKPETKPEVNKIEPKVGTKPEPVIKPDAKPDIKPVVKPESRTETKPKPEVKEANINTKPEIKENKDIKKPEPKTETKPEAKKVQPKVDTKPDPVVRPEPKPEVKPSVKPEPVLKPEVKSVVKPETKPEAKKVEPKVDTKPEPVVVPQSKKEVKPKPVPHSDTKETKDPSKSIGTQKENKNTKERNKKESVTREPEVKDSNSVKEDRKVKMERLKRERKESKPSLSEKLDLKRHAKNIGLGALQQTITGKKIVDKIYEKSKEKQQNEVKEVPKDSKPKDIKND